MEREKMNAIKGRNASHQISAVLGLLILGGCGISAETRSLIDEYNRSIPICDGEADCRLKWETAYNWVVETPSYPIRVSNEERIETYDADSTRAGTEIRVTREPLGGGRYQFLVDVDCFAIDRCPPYWETKIDFNRVVGSAAQ